MISPTSRNVLDLWAEVARTHETTHLIVAPNRRTAAAYQHWADLEYAPIRLVHTLMLTRGLRLTDTTRIHWVDITKVDHRIHAALTMQANSHGWPLHALFAANAVSLNAHTFADLTTPTVPRPPR